MSLHAMHFDLNVPIPQITMPQVNKKGKVKQEDIFTASQLEDLETRVDLLVHCMSSILQEFGH
jgi:hypothetical protein